MADLKYIGKNILNHDLLVKNGKIIGDHTEVIKVTVVSDGGNKYAFEGATTPDFTIDEGKTYRFDQSDSTNDNHPLRFSTVENGAWGGGSAYTTGVVTHGTPGVKGAYTEISVTKVTPNHLYYYCTQHSGMGNDALLLKNDFSNLHRVSGSASSTGSFGRLEIAGNSNLTGDVTIGGNINIGDADTDSLTISADLTSNLVPNADSTYDIGSLTKNWKVGHIEQISSTNITASSDISSSGNVTAESFTGIFQGALSGSAQIASNISGAFSVASASFASDINNLQSDSASFSTRVTNLKTDSGSFSTRITADSSSFSTRVTRNEGTGSKILNGQLEFTNITASGNITAEGNISGSATSTGSFGNLRIAGMSVSDVTVFSSSLSTRITADSSSFAARDTLSETTSSKILNGELEFTNITGSGHISMSISSTGSFGRLEATTIGGHSPLVIDANLTQSAAIKFDNKVFVNNIFTSSLNSQMDLQGRVVLHTGSIVGALDISTKSGSSSDSMRFGKAQSSLRISGSGNVSRFATGSDGSIIDLGFTIIDEDGNKVLSGDGDGIHVDSNNYWYNNRFYRIGNATTKYLSYNDDDIKYRGEVILNTGSFEGDVYIKTNNNNMVIGKSTTGLSISGSDGVSRFATGSDGQIIDLGFTVTDEEGDVTITNIGDGIHVDSNNYWYTSGHFKIGDANNFIDWNTNNLTVSGAFSGSFHGDGSGLTGISTTNYTTLTSSGDVLFQSDLTVGGKLTAQEIHTEIESASVIFTSGSTIFGNSIDDTHTFTGSIFLTGSVSASTFLGDGSKLTGISSSPITALNNATANELVTVGSTTTELDAEPNLTFDGSNGKLILSGLSYPNIQVIGTQLGYLMVGDSNATSNFQNYQLVSDGDNFEVRRVNDAVSVVNSTPFKISSDIVEVLNISGSATSTGSFGSLDVANNSSFGLRTKFGPLVGVNTNNPGTGIAGGSTSNTGLVQIYGGNYSQLRLQVAGTYQAGMYLYNSTATATFFNGYANNTSYGGFRWTAGGNQTETDGTEIMRLWGGRLGIMNTNPPKTLTVGGDISASGDFHGLNGTLTLGGNISGSATSTGSFGDVQAGPYIKLEGRTGDVWAGAYNSTSGKAILTKTGTQVRIGELEAESSAHPLHIYSAGSSIANFANSAGGTLTLGSTLIKSDDGSYFPNSVGFGAVADASYTVDIGGTPLLGFKRSSTRVGYIQTTSDNDLDISTNNSGYKLRLNVFNNGEVHTGTGKFVLGGNISGSNSSTGSIGRLVTTGDLNLSGHEVTINSTGIGIGNTNPARKLAITETATNVGVVRLYASNGGYADTVLDIGAERANNSAYNLLNIRHTSGLSDIALRVTGQGRTGIGTGTPAEVLDVVGNIQSSGNISGSNSSTGSIGSLKVSGASIDFTNVPTSDPGIAGRVWRDGTDLKISTG